jgi:hypothetical protein
MQPPELLAVLKRLPWDRQIPGGALILLGSPLTLFLLTPEGAYSGPADAAALQDAADAAGIVLESAPLTRLFASSLSGAGAYEEPRLLKRTPAAAVLELALFESSSSSAGTTARLPLKRCRDEEQLVQLSAAVYGMYTAAAAAARGPPPAAAASSASDNGDSSRSGGESARSNGSKKARVMKMG